MLEFHFTQAQTHSPLASDDATILNVQKGPEEKLSTNTNNPLAVCVRMSINEHY